MVNSANHHPLDRFFSSTCAVSSSLATPLWQAGKWAWSHLGGSGSAVEQYWHQRSLTTRTRLKAMGAVSGAAVTAMGTGALATVLFPALPGVVLAGSLVTGVASGVGTAGYRWLCKKDSVATSLAMGITAGLTMGVCANAFATPGLFYAAAVAAPITPVIATTAHMAMNPDQMIAFQVPNGPLRQFYTPSLAPVTPLEPAITLKQLTGKISLFRSVQPQGLFWNDPQIAEIKALSPTALAAAFAALDALSNPTHQQKIQAVARALGPTYAVDLAFIEKIEAIPFDSKEYRQTKENTDAQLDLFARNAAHFSTIHFIHSNRLGFKQTNETTQLYKIILAESTTPLSDGTLPSLWDIYMKHLGHQLGFFQKIRARFWYWISYTLDILPNTLRSLLQNFIASIRTSVSPSYRGNLDQHFKDRFEQLSLLLDLYLLSATSYVKEGSAANHPLHHQGTLAMVQKLAIDRLGNDRLYQKVLSELQPGEDVGKKMMKALCQQLTQSFVDTTFPPIKIWQKAKKIPILGLFVRGLAFLLETIFNLIIKTILRSKLPPLVESFVENGIDQTMPGQYAFKIAVVNSIRESIEEAKNDLDHPSTSKPAKHVQKTLIQGVAKRILQALKLKKLGENPTRLEVAAYLREIENPAEPEIDLELENQLIAGAQGLMFVYANKPEKLEQLFEHALLFSNNAFKVGAPVQTALDYDNAYHHLRTTAKEFIRDAIKHKVQAELRGPNLKTVREYLDGKKDANGRTLQRGLFETQQVKGLHIFKTLDTICQTMLLQTEGTSLLRELHHYMEVLKDFAAHAQAMDIDLYPEIVQGPFYHTFHPLYVQASQLATLTLALQKQQIDYLKQQELLTQLELLQQLSADDLSQTHLFQQILTKLKADPHAATSELQVFLSKMQEKIIGLTIARSDLKEQIQVIQTLARKQQTPIPSQFLIAKAAIENLIYKIVSDIKVECRTTVQFMSSQRESDLQQIQQKMHHLKAETMQSYERLQAATLPVIAIPMATLPQRGIDLAYEYGGKPIQKKIELYLDTAFALATDRNLCQGAARLLMGHC